MKKNQNIKAVMISKNCITGANEFLKYIERQGVKIAYVSLSTVEEDTYVKTTEQLKVPTFHCVVFDDTLEGIKAAKAKKIRTVAVNNTDLKDIADQFITTFDSIDKDTFLESGRVHQMPVCETAIIEEEFHQNDIHHMESLFALGNGYLGLRGTYDETDENIGEVCGMYINGIFATEPYKHYVSFPGFAKQEEFTVNLADWRIINLYVDGEKACFSAENIKKHKRVLDMQKGRIQRTFVFETANGKRLAVESIRIVNMNEVHGAEISYTVCPLNFSGEIVLEMQVVKNTRICNQYPCQLVEENFENNVFSFTQEIQTTKQKVATAIVHQVEAENYLVDSKNEENRFIYTVTVNVKEEEKATVYKYAAFYSSMDAVGDMSHSAERLACQNAALGFKELDSRQCDFWNAYWKKGDIEIKGNPSDAQAVKLSLFQLRQQLATINACSIGATGLTGPGYSGKVFWDTEMYLMPYYNFTYPETQKELLMYRYRILDKARERAQEFRLPGAMYSWCSIDGEETSIVFEASTAEYHLNSDIAYAIWRYVDSTGDKEFLYQYGAEIVFETAKFMFHRGCFIEANGGKFCMNVVCGPDEYACGINNNCYTNLMLQFHLNYALSVAEEMKRNVPEIYEELAYRIALREEELAGWKKAADNIYYKYNEELGIHEQDDSFVRNDPVDMSKIPMNCDIRGRFHPLDLWRIQVSKQADVVLINFIRGNLFTQEEKLRNYDYYEPRCNHGSSLSTAIHAIMASELGKPEAYEFFRCSAYMDIGDFKHNTGGGLHLACLGGVWMTIVNGFLGMRHYEDGLHFKPHIPSAWEAYSCYITYRDATMKIRVTAEDTVFEKVEGKELSFRVGKDKVRLTDKKPCFTCMTQQLG